LNSHYTFLICDPPKVAGGGRAVHPINWRKRYGGMGRSQLQEFKTMEKENSRLKKIVAELELEKLILKESLDFLKPKV